jgi:hypothetical protein
MCIFTRDAAVQSTSIFAKREGSAQILVYEARVDSRGENAMILPIPRAPQGEIELINLSAYSTFFSFLKSGYIPTPPMPFGAPLGAPQHLEVFQVGAFDASVALTPADLNRLDQRLALSPALRAAITARYADHSFVIFRLGQGKRHLHPFGVRFETRYPNHLYFPTVHVHDGGDVPATATFAHELFAQDAQLAGRYEPIPQPWNPPGTLQWLPAFIDQAAPLDYGTRYGQFANVDIFAPG